MSTVTTVNAVSTDTGRVLYVAEPIDQSNHGAWKEEVTRSIKVATDRGWLVYRPAGAWRLGKQAPVGPEIEAVNRHVLLNARAVLAFLPKGVASIGVPRELEWASSNGTPALAVTDATGSWSLADVPVAELGDIPSLGQWLVAIENEPPPGHGVGFAVGERGRLPARTNAGDAGFDLYVSETTVVPPGEFVDVPCDLRVALPFSVYGRITGRSSTLRKRHLLVAEGIIDTGYRGQLYSGVFNLGQSEHTIQRGERIAQLILHENIAGRYQPVSIDHGYFARIPGDSRGEAGFGSTGA